MSKEINITFGMIVLNGEPFTRYNLRALYPYAHQIIVVEGACPGAKNVATTEGHSLDGTLDVLWQFKKKEDPENKLVIITAEDNGHDDGFWAEKDEMSQAYAQRATGNYLWQVDSDEFYLPEDIEKIIGILSSEPDITAVSFRTVTFWGSPDYITDSFYLRGGARDFHRLFAWKPSFCYSTHRPPTVNNESGKDLKEIKHLSADDTCRLGIKLYHFSLLFPKQVQEKSEYYSKANWNKQNREAIHWANECYMKLRRPYRVHSVYASLSWIERFTGPHHPQILAMIEAVNNDKHPDIQLRETNDIESLLQKIPYKIGSMTLGIIADPYIQYKKTTNKLRQSFGSTPLGEFLKSVRSSIWRR